MESKTKKYVVEVVDDEGPDKWDLVSVDGNRKGFNKGDKLIFGPARLKNHFSGEVQNCSRGRLEIIVEEKGTQGDKPCYPIAGGWICT